MIEIDRLKAPQTSNDESPNDGSAAIVLDSVGYTYDTKTPWSHGALEDISLSISPGGRLLVVGENGSGKSTLAWILAGLYKPTVGQALLGERPLSEQLQSLGFVIQHTRLQLLSATIAEEFQGFGIPVADANRAMSQMGLAALPLSRRVEELSVGQQRRVGMAVIFARSCPVVILDEPLAGLDPEGADRIAAAVRAMPATTTVITVTHDLEASTALADDVVQIDHGSISKTWRL